MLLEDDKEVHVIPEEDIVEHDLSELCSCQPRVEYHQIKNLIIHNSFDGREAFESGTRLPS